METRHRSFCTSIAQVIKCRVMVQNFLSLSSRYFRPVNIRTHSSLLRLEQICGRHTVRK